MFFILLFILAVAFSCFYVLLMRFCIKGWNRLKDFEPPAGMQPRNRFTIIIPARNEEVYIADCLKSVAGQDYPPGSFEVIVADDFSTDGTAAVVERFMAEEPTVPVSLLKMEELADEGEIKNTYKKKAIEAAIARSRYEWIITTDADCIREPHWLHAIDTFIQMNDPYLVSATVQMESNGTFFQKAQALEFLGLIGIGAASMRMGAPNMCNGANLIYRKDIFYECGGYTGDTLASGDDEFLMHKVFAKAPEKVMYLKSEAAIVSTRPETSLRGLIRQRRRWVSKSRKYTRKGITAVLVGAYLYHFLMLLSLLLALFHHPYYLFPFITALGAKQWSEYIFLRKVCRWFHRRDLLRIYIPASLIYIAYVLFIGIYGNFGKYNWKGRRVS